MFQMSSSQAEHLGAIQLDFNRLVQKKYEKGVREHGGNLWEKTGLIDMAIDEAVDQVVYLLTLKQQINDGRLGIVNEVPTSGE